MTLEHEIGRRGEGAKTLAIGFDVEIEDEAPLVRIGEGEGEPGGEGEGELSAREM